MAISLGEEWTGKYFSYLLIERVLDYLSELALYPPTLTPRF